MSRASGSIPAARARRMTLGLSAMKIPFSGSRRERSWASVSRAKTSSSGAERSETVMIRSMAQPQVKG